MAGAARAAEPVDTAIVLAVDVSTSVNDERYALQRDGTAEAFATDQVVKAITSGPHGAIEAAVLEFSDPDRQFVVMPWTRIASADEARAFARALHGARRSSHGLTGLTSALLAAQALLAQAPYPADRRIVDMSSDGMCNIGPPVETARDALVAAGITINGLPILTEESWLADYYAESVIGGPDSFVEVAQDIGSFEKAMEQKLKRELLISQGHVELPRVE